MTAPLKPSDLPELIYRLGRAPDPWEWPDWTYAREDGTFGNRYDDPEGQYRVLYASTQREATFRECLARFRPDLSILAENIEEDDKDAPPTRPPGHISRSWLTRRLMGTATPAGVYCAIGHSDSVQHLRDALAPRILCRSGREHPGDGGLLEPLGVISWMVPPTVMTTPSASWSARISRRRGTSVSRAGQDPARARRRPP